MQGHFRVDAPDLAARTAQAQTQVRLLTRDQAGPVAALRLHRGKKHKRIAAAGQRQPQGRVPFQIRQPIVNRCLGKALAPPAADHHRAWTDGESGARSGDPARRNRAIAIHKLHEFRRIIGQGQQPRIAGARGGKGLL